MLLAEVAASQLLLDVSTCFKLGSAGASKQSTAKPQTPLLPPTPRSTLAVGPTPTPPRIPGGNLAIFEKNLSPRG